MVQSNIQIQSIFPTFNNQLIEKIIENVSITQVSSGNIIMRTGQYIKNTVLVIEGKIKVYREDEEGKEFFMYYLLPGQACAISMICATKSEKSQIMAKVVEDATLAMLPLHLMDKWMVEYKNWYEFVIDTYKNRFEEILQVLDSVAFRNMDERLHYYLKSNGKTNNTNHIKTSHLQIANDLNTSREVISRLLKKMEQRGLLKLHRSYIEIFFLE